MKRMNGNSRPSRAGMIGKLFVSMLYISAFTFGGGFVIVSLMKKRIVDELHWITEEEMLDMTAIAQSSPGAIAVNAAILVGSRVGGAAGLAAAVVGTIIPPMVILSVISVIYAQFVSNPVVAALLKGMQAGVAAVIMDVALSLGTNVARKKSLLSWAILILSFVSVAVWKVNVVYIVLAAAGIGVLHLLLGKRGRSV